LQGKSRRLPSQSSFRFWELYLRTTTIAIALAGLHLPHGWVLLFHDSAFLRGFGTTLVIASADLFVWAERSLGDEYSPCYDSFLPGRLVRQGPYRFMRHPLYTSNIILLWGVMLVCGSLWLLPNCLLLMWFYARAAVSEESALAADLPDYQEYMTMTGRYLPRPSRRRRDPPDSR